MNKGRIEAFSDGVLAIIITIMVLEIKVPHGGELRDLNRLLPVFLSYILSFIYIGIYWNNHHHMMQMVSVVTGDILWANLHLLFWLSLVPFTSGWIGENNFDKVPMGIYGINLFFAAIAYYVLQLRIIKSQGKESILAKTIGKDWKGKFSPLLYLAAIFSSILTSWIAGFIYILVALIWLIPDPRIEKKLNEMN